MNKTLVIAAAGTGSRLGKYTKYFNKAMCTLGPKPVISYIIEKFTKNDEIIVLLGYKGDLLKQVVKICYPEWNIKFVNVDKFEGPDSGPGYSLLCAREYLNKPFVYWSNDTLIDDDIETFDFSKNWLLVGDFDEKSAHEYRHAQIDENGMLVHVHEKNIYEKNEKYLPSIELCYVKDYEGFWRGADEHREEFIKVGVNAGLNYIGNPVFAVHTKTWTDTGKSYLFEKYHKDYSAKMEENVLEKEDEFIWFIDNHVIKFHVDESFISGRIERHRILSELLKGTKFKLPEITAYDRNVYSYRREPGRLLSDVVTPKLFKDFIEDWFANVPRIDDEKMAEDLYIDFFRNKTVKRVNTCCRMHDIEDSEVMINGVVCKPAMDILNKVDWKKISKYAVLSKKVHGDFHLDNVLYNQDTDKYILLDWRQRFATSTIGDMSYDLGKLFMAFFVNYEAAVKHLFKIEKITETNLNVDIYQKFVYAKCKEILTDYIIKHFGEEMLVHAHFIHILIMFGSSGCHPDDYGAMLFYLGKCMLNEFYNEHREYFIG